MISHSDFQFNSSTILKWTGEEKLFDKDFIIIPINENLHWLLVIVCFVHDTVNPNCTPENTRAKILVFDSMKTYSRTKRICDKIRRYLGSFWFLSENSSIELNPQNLPHEDLTVPQQTNGSDCGLFLLHYLEKFTKNPTNDSSSVCFFFILLLSFVFKFFFSYFSLIVIGFLQKKLKISEKISVL